jgi:hypothetical protein
MHANPERLAFLIGLGADFIEYSEETRKVGGPAPYGDGLQIGTGPISLYAGIVLVAVIGLVAYLYYRKTQAQQAEEVSVAAAS